MFKKTVLDSGLTVVTESHHYQRSVAVGAFIQTGTRDETKPLMGISHFLEHMVFKGTQRRSTFDIARSLESVGGDLNAYTTREYTCYHALSLKENLKLDIDILGDLVCHARFPNREFEKERNVILQEVSMTEENYEELIHDLFFERIYEDDSLGWPILGNEESLSQISRSDVLKYYRERYQPRKIIVAAAGSLDHNEVVEHVEKYFKKSKIRTSGRPRFRPRFKKIREVVTKKSEQCHILVGFNGLSFVDRERFEAFVLNAWLGGGMSSKLYQSIREKKGLAYTVYSGMTSFSDCGVLTIYAAADTDSLETVINTIKRDLKDVRRKKLNESQVDLFKKQVLGQIVLGADDMENRMTSLGINEMTYGEYVPLEDVVERIDGVSGKGIRDLAQELLDWDRASVMILGDVDPQKVKEIIK